VKASISVENVTRSYGEFVAVDDVSFHVEAGEVVGLLGPNGAGKTTTLRMLATLLEPDAGTVRVGGYDVGVEPLVVRAHIGYQTGDTGLYGRLTAVEFLRYFGRLHDMAPDALEQRIETLVADFDMEDFAEQRCETLSTGQKQRVGLARALLHDPPVLVLDEPTAGLDIVSSQFVMRTLEAARDEDRAILFSTHILSEVELVCDRVLVLHQGRIIARGTVGEIIEQAGHADEMDHAGQIGQSDRVGPATQSAGAGSFAHAFMALIGETEST